MSQDKTGRSGSLPHMINGACLLAVFFGARLVYGTFLVSIDTLSVDQAPLLMRSLRMQSFDFWRSMIKHRAEIPYTLHCASPPISVTFFPSHTDRSYHRLYLQSSTRGSTSQ